MTKFLLPLADTSRWTYIVVHDHPGCPGTAARLPISPGSQKLKPPASAMAAFDAAMVAPSASAPAKAYFDTDL